MVDRKPKLQRVSSSRVVKVIAIGKNVLNEDAGAPALFPMTVRPLMVTVPIN